MEVGRPTIMTPETISKLEEAFLNGASDKEAIFLANISSSTFYAYCQDNPDFSERKEALKDMVKYQARQNIVNAINNGDKPLSQWYLERKAKSEFAQRQEHTGEEGGAIKVTGIEMIIPNVKDNITTDTEAV
jgi:hypothetical protein